MHARQGTEGIMMTGRYMSVSKGRHVGTVCFGTASETGTHCSNPEPLQLLLFI